MSYATGSLVRARNREWVVLPESSDDLLMLRPLGGTDAEITGILTDLEPIESATFALPDPSDLGDYRSAAHAPRRVAARLPLQRGSVPLVRPDRRDAAPVSAGAAAHGAQARPGAPADRRRRRHRQDHRGGADRQGAAGAGRLAAHVRALPAAPRRAVAAGAGREVPHRRRARAVVDGCPPRAWPPPWPVAVRRVPEHGGVDRLHQVRPPPRRLHPGLSRLRDRRRGPHLRRRRRRQPQRSPPAPPAGPCTLTGQEPAPRAGDRDAALRQGGCVPQPARSARRRVPLAARRADR